MTNDRMRRSSADGVSTQLADDTCVSNRFFAGILLLSFWTSLLTSVLAPVAVADEVSKGALPSQSPPQRMISLNPSLTAIAIRLGAGDQLVGVDEYSASLLEAVSGLPKVGGLFDPSLESILALRPDVVLIVAGIDQRRHALRLERLGIKVEVFENERLDQVLENIERLGAMLGRPRAAAARIDAILATRRAVAKAVEGRPRRAALAIVDRSPLFLVGAETFIDEMLEAVGARNLARALGPGYPRGSIEWVIEAKPELLLDMTPGSDRPYASEPGGDGAGFWSRWPSLPAVAAGRVFTLDASRISLPGPDLDRALRELAAAVHGPEIEASIDAALSASSASSRATASARTAGTPTP